MRRLVLAAALLLGGCIDFKQITEPEPPPPPEPEPEVAAEFHASIVFEDGFGRPEPGGPGEPPPGSGVRIHAVLNPGRGPTGVPRPIRDDTLRVSGTALAPTRVEVDGTRQYQGWVPLGPASEAGMLLAIAPPAVSGRDAWPSVLYQAVPARIGGDTVEVAAGADLRLPFSLPAPLPGAQPPDQGWHLEVGGGQTHFAVSGVGPPPNPLVVPLGLIPETNGTPLSARLYVNSRTGLGSREDGGYFVEIVFNASLGWVVRRAPSAPAG